MSAAEWIAKARSHGGRSQEMRARYPRALDALEAVLQTHAPVDALDVARRPGQQLTRVCTGCGTDDGNYQRWPCPTVRAIETALRADA